MTDTLKIYGASTPERQKLEAAAMLINSNFEGKYATARVSDEWFDYEGGIKWTTIMVGPYPALNPQQQTALTAGNIKDFANVVSAVVRTHWERISMLNDVRYGLEED